MPCGDLYLNYKILTGAPVESVAVAMRGVVAIIAGGATELYDCQGVLVDEISDSSRNFCCVAAQASTPETPEHFVLGTTSGEIITYDYQ